MPESSVQLSVWLRGVEHEEQERVAREDIYEYEFAVWNRWEPIDGKEFQTYPFEERQENLDLMEDLKSHLEERFPEAEVELYRVGTGTNLVDNSPPAEKLYKITVDARTENKKAEQSEKCEEKREQARNRLEEAGVELGEREFGTSLDQE